MTQPPAPPAPGDDGKPPSLPPVTPPSSAELARQQASVAKADTVAYPVASGLTKLAKIGDTEPKIDTAKRAQIDKLWKFAYQENASPGSTIGSLATVPLQADDAAVTRSPSAPRGGVIVEDPTGKVVVHGGHGDETARENTSGGSRAGALTDAHEEDDLSDSLSGGTIDAPPDEPVTDAPRDAMGNAAGGAGSSPHAPTLIGSHPVTRGSQAPTHRGSSATGARPPVSSTAVTVPGGWTGLPDGGPVAGAKAMPASRVMSPRPEDFRIEAKLASGGMGDVYLATQLGLQRVVALKRPKASLQASDHRINAFVREGTVTGDLEHPSIVPIYQNGVDADGLPYYAMKLVHGIEWRYLLHPDAAQERKDAAFIKAVALKGAAMDLHEHLGVLLKVCDAVAFAHSRHILHRDIKPENVIVGDFGEVQVMDWGLAIDFRDETPAASKALSRTNIRGPAGTPAYMAPEMALGEVAKISPATDVYLLGAILYEILTGRPPHSGSKLDRVLYQAAVNEYVPVGQANLDAPPGLIAIVDKALATEPRDRFESVQVFQQAIREHITHEQSLKISAKAQGELDKLLEARPQSGLIAVADESGPEASARYIKFAEIVASFRQALDLWPLNEQARAGLHQGLVAFIEAALAGGDLGLAQAQIEQLRSVAAATAGPPENGNAARIEVAQLAARWQVLDDARRARQRNFKLALGSVAALLVILVVGGIYSYLNIVLERDRAETERGIAETQKTEAVKQRGIAETQKTEAEKQRSLAEHARMEADQQRQSAEQNAQLAQKNEATAIVEKKEADHQRGIADDQRKQAETQKTEAEKQRTIADQQRQVAEAKTKEAELARTAAEQSRAVAIQERAQAVKNLGAVDIQHARTLIAANRDYPQAAAFLIRAIQNMAEVDPSKPLRELDVVFQASPWLRLNQDLDHKACGLLFLPSAHATLAVLKASGYVDWIQEGQKYIRRDTDGLQKDSPARSLAIFQSTWIVLDTAGALNQFGGEPLSPDGALEPQVTIRPLVLSGYEKTRFTCLIADPTGLQLALGTADGHLLLLESPITGTDSNPVPEGTKPAPATPPPPTLLLDLAAHRGSVSGLAFRAKTREIITTGADGKLCVWDIASRKQVRARQAHIGFASALAVDPSGSSAATAGADGVIKVWNLADLSERITLQGHQREVGSLAFHPLKPVLASQSFDGTVRLWNIAAESLETAPLATLHVANDSSALQVIFAPDGDTLACLNNGDVALWDLRDRVNATPPAWKDLRLNPARLLYASAGAAESVVLRGDRGILTLGPGEDAPRSSPAPNVVAAFLPVSDPAHPCFLNTAGQFGPVDHFAPIDPDAKPADLKVTGWAVLGSGVLVNCNGALYLANTAEAAWRFRPLQGGADSVGVALSTDGRIFSWTADNRMSFSTPAFRTAAGVDPAGFEVAHLPTPYPQKILQAVWVPRSWGVILRTGGADLPIVNRAGQPAGAIVGHHAPVRTMALDPTGRFLISADASGQLRLTDLSDLTGAPFGPPLPAPADDLLFDATGVFLYAHLEDGQLIRYRLPQADPQYDIFELREKVHDLLGVEPGDFAPAAALAKRDAAPAGGHP